MGLASRARQSWSKKRKRPHFASLSQANPSPESNIFLKNRTKKSSRICRGFEQLSSYCGWRVITKKPRATIVALVGVKGLRMIKDQANSKAPESLIVYLYNIWKEYHSIILYPHTKGTQRNVTKYICIESLLQFKTVSTDIWKHTCDCTNMIWWNNS